jgi:hypothetical protein
MEVEEVREGEAAEEMRETPGTLMMDRVNVSPKSACEESVGERLRVLVSV